MSKLQILGTIALATLLLAPDALAQRRGGAVRSGVRGAAVGGMVGGSSGAETGAKVGVVAGATRGVAARTADRSAMNAEAQARTQYESSAEYQNVQHSDFAESPPEVIVTSSEATSVKPVATAEPVAEAIVSKDGKPIVGITYPSDWKQKSGDHFVSAISPKRNAWSVIATLEGVKVKEEGIEQVKQGLEKYLQDVEYDDPTNTERGALMITGTGNGKKTGLPVVFAAGVFEASPGQIAGAAFVVDKNDEEHYKEAVLYMCKTIRGEKDFAEQKKEVK